VAETTERGNHLVGAEQDSVAVAELPHAREVAIRRREAASCVLHGLEDEHRDGLGPRPLDRLLEIVEEKRRELRLSLLGGPVVPVRVLHVEHLGHEGLERLAEGRDARDRERAERRPVVRDVPGDGLPAPLTADAVVLTGELPRRLDRLRTAGDKEDAVEVARSEPGHLGGELDRARVRVAPVRVEGELAHLRRRGLPHLVAEAVPDLDGEQGGEPVEVSLPVRVFEVAAVPTHDDRHLGVEVAGHAREVQPEVGAGSFLQLLGCPLGGQRFVERAPQRPGLSHGEWSVTSTLRLPWESV
jgi:hypothetical protein